MTTEISAEQRARKRALDVLASAPSKALAERWDAFGDKPDHQRLRGPETGLVMVRGRAGGGRFGHGRTSCELAICGLAMSTGHAVTCGPDAPGTRARVMSTSEQLGRA